jgi:VIT1/CCC1 family predicted Fe2+/Mn2+ transporter
MNKEDIKRHLANLRDERNGVALYLALAAAEKDPALAEIYRRFAATEGKHAAAWEERLGAAGVTVPAFRPSWRTRTLALLARKLGVSTVLATVTGMEQAGAKAYAAGGDAPTLAADEASHARLLERMAQTGSAGLAGGEVARLEGRHRAGGGNALRAAVLGANDGLVSNLSLVMGVAGAALSGQSILVTGLAGLLAGACSMALGEWVSVQSSRELYQRQIEIERAEIADSPADEAEELALIYQSRGVPAEQARALADHIMTDRQGALQTLVREELGIDPEELGGSAWVAAGTSFALFAAGAVVPVIPFTFLGGSAAIAISLALSTLGLFVIGAAITLFTGRPPVWSGARMVVFGLAAAAVTFGIGRLIGVSLG